MMFCGDGVCGRRITLISPTMIRTMEIERIENMVIHKVLSEIRLTFRVVNHVKSVE